VPEQVPDLAVSNRAKRDAYDGRDVTLKSIQRTSAMKRRNHIAEDIGKAYLILHGKA
jgi:hypothetical protein